MTKYYLSICLVIRVVNPYMLAELLGYYRMVGVEHFYIFDNRSIYDLSELLKGMKDEVTLHVYDGENGQETVQMNVYNFCVKQYRNETEYLIFVDDDVFINFKDEFNTIPEVIRKLGEPDGIVLNWIFNGCSSRVRSIHEFLIESNCLTDDKFDIQTKGIYRMSKIVHVENPHWVHYTDESRVVDGTGKDVIYRKGFHQLESFPLIWQHHYFIQSVSEFRLTCDRGLITKETKRNFDKMIEVNKEYTKIKNLWMERWVKKFKEHNYTPQSLLDSLGGSREQPNLEIKYLSQKI